MGMDYKVNEFGEIIREDGGLHALEEQLLNGIKLNIDARKRLAAESRNIKVLDRCMNDKAITVRRIVWSNPALTPEMRKEAMKQKLIDRKSVTPIKSVTITKPVQTNPVNQPANNTQSTYVNNTQQNYGYTQQTSQDESGGISASKVLWWLIMIGLIVFTLCSYWYANYSGYEERYYQEDGPSLEYNPETGTYYYPFL